MRPGDHVTVRTCGQGWQHPRVPPGVMVMNAGPGLLDTLPVAWPGDGPMTVGVRAILPSELAGNGIGRPAAVWDLDLQLPAGPGGPAGDARPPGSDVLLLGDLVAVTGLDARHNMGYRKGWLTVGRGRARHQPAARARARHYPDPHRTARRAFSSGRCHWSPRFDRIGTGAKVTDDELDVGGPDGGNA